jgi:hypothetical protein
MIVSERGETAERRPPLPPGLLGDQRRMLGINPPDQVIPSHRIRSHHAHMISQNAYHDIGHLIQSKLSIR